MRLDLDATSVQADERVRDGASEHTAKLDGNLSRVCDRTVTEVELLRASHEHVLEVLARAPPGAPIHVPAVPLLQPQPARSRISG